MIIPKEIDRDINCSMLFMAADIPVEKLRSAGREFEDEVSHIFFADGRDVVFDEG
ncbi:hypothetical protein JCM15831A_03220 [Asaia astilbis]